MVHRRSATERGPKQWWVAEQALDDEGPLGDAHPIALDRSTERGVVERAVVGDARVVRIVDGRRRAHVPVASRTVRRCSRPGCGALAVVLLGFDASRSLAWFAPLDDEGALHGSELCHRHAESVRVPKGWWLDDRRVASPQLFNPAPNPPAPPPIAHSGPAEVPPVSKQSSAPAEEDPLPLEATWRPVFDQGDDLDGLLDAGTPLLGRAFSGRPRAPRPG